MPRWASAETVRRASAHREALLRELGPWPDDLLPLVGQVSPFTGTTLPWDGPRVELVVHDAHVPGHTAVWLPAQRILLAGDMLSDVEPPLPEDGPAPLAAYARGLDALAPLVEQAAWVVPGHGNPGQDAPARLARDRRALETLTAREGP